MDRLIAESELCDVDVTADQVSWAMRELDEELGNWRNRPIGEVKILFADVTYHKVRVDGVGDVHHDGRARGRAPGHPGGRQRPRRERGPLKMMRQIGDSAPLSKLGRNRVAIRFGRHALTAIFCDGIMFYVYITA